MSDQFEFGDLALQPLSGIGEALHVAGVDGAIERAGAAESTAEREG